MAALATPAQLGAFMQQPLADTDATALLLLDIASGMVRDYLNAQIDQVLDEVALCDPVYGQTVFLPEMPVTAVTLVEVYDDTVTPAVWTTVDPKMYVVSTRMGVIEAKPCTGVTWPSAPATWRVTYSHGYAVIPSTIVGTVLGAAAREWNTVNGVDSERVGGYQVKYAMEDAGFTALETKALARYVNPRIA